MWYDLSIAGNILSKKDGVIGDIHKEEFLEILTRITRSIYCISYNDVFGRAE
jgi:hypothetical protein